MDSRPLQLCRQFGSGGGESLVHLADVSHIDDDELVDPDAPRPSHQQHSSGSSGLVRIEQFVRRVIDFSSQYGSDSSISFTAQNITGQPTRFPDYGDFAETFAMRSYGPWSERSASHAAEFQPQTLHTTARHPPQDYITLEFEEFVWPSGVSVFESYNPGAIHSIWALNMFQWQLLWHRDCAIADKAAPDAAKSRFDNEVNQQPRARIFSPPLAVCASPTRCIRLEFEHRRLDYFAELDAVLLVGWRVADLQRLQRQVTQRRLGRIERLLKSVAFRPLAGSGRAMDRFLAGGDLQRFEEETARDGGLAELMPIQRLPHELLVQIAGYLDMISLCRLAQTNRQLRTVAYDPHLYTAVNLRPYWALAPGRTNLLAALQQRCSLIRQLDVSWSCCQGSGIQPPDVVSFVAECGGRTLRELRMNSCPAMRAPDVCAVLAGCAGGGAWLTELSLRNFREGHLMRVADCEGLQRLVRLDLYHTDFATEVIVDVLARNCGLRHLNVAHGGTQTNMDAVAVQLAESCRGLRSLDMWKSYGLSAAGLAVLAECGELEELDIGWCLRDEAALGDSLQTVLRSNSGGSLRRLGLASIRGLNADDLDAIAQRCWRMEQLELMGIRGVSADKCLEILYHCRRLELLDVSFCDSIEAIYVDMLRMRYPCVYIKWSRGDDDDDNSRDF